MTLIDVAITLKMPEIAKTLLHQGALPSKNYVERFNKSLWAFAAQHDFIKQAEVLFEVMIAMRDVLFFATCVEDRLWAEIESDDPDLEVIEAMCAHGIF